MVIAPRDFRDEEYFEPKAILEKAGFDVITSSFKVGEVQGAGGKTTQADVLVSEVKPEEFQAVVFVGGPGMVDLVNNPDLIKLAKQFCEAQKIVSAICVAPSILANAGILKGLSATGWSGITQNLLQKGANVINKPVVWSGKVITAEGPMASQEFGETLVKALSQ